MIEKLAAHCHDKQWSGWMSYMFDKCKYNEDGSVTIPAELVQRWTFQMKTSYAELPEEMRESDRAEAREILKVINV